MERLCFIFEIAEGKEAEYDRVHQEIWPELVDAIIDVGYRNYTLFRRATRVICFCECHPDVPTVRRLTAERHQDLFDRWNALMQPLIVKMTDERGELFEYPECWHLKEDRRQ
jgi:L-rhamnose mutarotase